MAIQNLYVLPFPPIAIVGQNMRRIRTSFLHLYPGHRHVLLIHMRIICTFGFGMFVLLDLFFGEFFSHKCFSIMQIQNHHADDFIENTDLFIISNRSENRNYELKVMF